MLTQFRCFQLHCALLSHSLILLSLQGTSLKCSLSFVPVEGYAEVGIKRAMADTPVRSRRRSSWGSACNTVLSPTSSPTFRHSDISETVIAFLLKIPRLCRR